MLQSLLVKTYHIIVFIVLIHKIDEVSRQSDIHFISFELQDFNNFLHGLFDVEFGKDLAKLASFKCPKVKHIIYQKL